MYAKCVREHGRKLSPKLSHAIKIILIFKIFFLNLPLFFCAILSQNFDGSLIMHHAPKFIAALALTLASGAFAQDDNLGDKLLQVKGTMDSINEELSSQHADLRQLKGDLSSSAKEDRRVGRQILDELKALRRQNQALIDMNQALIKAAASGGSIRRADSSVLMNAGSRDYDIETPDGKMIFGGEEYVYVKEAEATLAARVDTGATVSSISATNITRYESDGVKMVSFTIEANDRRVEVEAPYIRVTRVRQSSAEDFSYRMVVGLNIKLGSYSVYSEFNLMDRTQMDFPMLLGRSLITDIAAVDVSRNYVQKRADPDGLLLINKDLYTLLKRNGKDPNAEYDAKRAREAGGQTAVPDRDDGANLGTDSSKALPEVSQKILRDEYKRRLTDAGVSLPSDLRDTRESDRGEAVKDPAPTVSADAKEAK